MTTNAQLMKLAAEGYKELIPLQGDCNRCFLGAAYFGKTGLYYHANPNYYDTLFRRSYTFISGVIHGFDGSLQKNGTYKTKRENDKYREGFMLGRRAAKRFLANGSEL